MDPHEAFAVLTGCKPFDMRLKMRREHGEALLEWIDGGGYLPGELADLTRREARLVITEWIDFVTRR